MEKSELTNAAQQIIDETAQGGNTKLRVGSLFKNIIDYFHSKSTTLTGANGSIINTNLSINDVFKSIAIVNKEMNCYIEGTAIEIEAIDTTAKTITLSWVPHIPSIINPEVGKQWVVGEGPGAEPSRNGQNHAYVRITGGSFATRVLTYDISRDTPSLAVGSRVYFYNIHANGWAFNQGLAQHLILRKAGTYYSRMTGPGGIYKHSDGKYRMVVNGYDGTTWRVGLFQSDNLATWTSVSDTPAVGEAAGTWRPQGIHITSVIKHPTENRYIGYAYGQGGTPFMMRIGWVKFDENMQNIEFSPTEIIDVEDTSSGLYEPSVIFYNGKYRMVVAARTNVLPDDGWQMWEYESLTPEGPWVKITSTIDTTSTAIRNVKSNFRNGHSTETCPFIFNGKLYMIICGTSRWNWSGNRGSRQFGILAYNDSESRWENYAPGIVMGSYQFSNTVWNRPEGHTGGSPVIFNTGDKLYLFFALTLSSDSYQVVGSSFNL
jgi:hypothetical protein